MNYVLKLSLGHMAVVKIATILWDQPDTRDLGKRFIVSPERERDWQVVEDKVTERASELSLPKPLIKKVLNVIKPIGREMVRWQVYHLLNFNITVQNKPNKLCWTPQGTVDKKKTAGLLIKDENIEIGARYKLACVYCFADNISELWERMPEVRRKDFYEVAQHELVVFWTYDITKEVPKRSRRIRAITQRFVRESSPYPHAFSLATCSGNKAATEYFLPKLTPGERGVYLMRCTENVPFMCNAKISSCGSAQCAEKHYTEVLLFLLSQMDDEQQTKVLQFRTCDLLKSLLHWPWQSMFVETACRTFTFLSNEAYFLLVKIIIEKATDGYEDYNYSNLLRDLWQRSPATYKRSVIRYECSNFELLPELFQIKDEENIKLILKDATLTEKKQIIFSSMGKIICENFICDEEWQLLQLLIPECISSRDEIEKLKVEYKEWTDVKIRRSTLELQRVCTRNRDHFFRLLDELVSHRNIEEGDNNPSKKLRSGEFDKTEPDIKK